MKNVIYKRKVVSVMELEKGMMYHIRLKKGDVGRYVLLPGDPFRTDLIATYFDEPKLIAHNREHKTWVGKLDGVPVAVCRHCVGRIDQVRRGYFYPGGNGRASLRRSL